MYKGISLPYKKKKKHPNTESQLYFSIKLNKSKKKKKKRKGKYHQEYRPQASGTGLLHPSCWGLPGSPRLNCVAAEGAGDVVPANEPLLGLECPVPCGWGPNLLIKAGPPTPHASRVHPRNGGRLCRKGSQESPARRACCWGSHLQPPSVGLTTPKEDGQPRHHLYGGAWDC